jgi:hypothetical protein
MKKVILVAMMMVLANCSTYGMKIQKKSNLSNVITWQCDPGFQSHPEEQHREFIFWGFKFCMDLEKSMSEKKIDKLKDKFICSQTPGTKMGNLLEAYHLAWHDNIRAADGLRKIGGPDKYVEDGKIFFR